MVKHIQNTWPRKHWRRPCPLNWLMGVVITLLLAGCPTTKTITNQPDTVIAPPKADVVISPDTQCQPQCTDKQCGDDGCGGICGTCLGCLGEAVANLCNPDGTCQQPCCASCEGRECGDDGCGGNCGDCPGCDGPDPLLCSPEGQCATACCPDCTGKICGTDGCGGSCGSCGQNMYCNDSGQCADATGCVPDCTDKQCGSNGCGGECGECGSSAVCDGAQHCVQVGNVGEPCGDVTFQGVCLNNQLFFCVNNVLQMADCAATGKACLPTSDGAGFDCLVPPCSPDCTNKNCGTNGCGGTCGACGPDAQCVEGTCTPTTAPCDGIPVYGQCVGNILKQCTNDALVETDCAADGKVCTYEPQFGVALCQSTGCTPNCANKQCGSDGCGGSCGTCNAGETCTGASQCVPTVIGSCTGLCNTLFQPDASCQCDAYCFVNDDCCQDICTVCAAQYADSCLAQGSICGTPFKVKDLPFTASKDTSGASADYSFEQQVCPGETSALGGSSNDHVWTFSAPTTASYTISLQADYDSLLYASTSCAITTSTCLKAHDLIGTGKTEFLTLDLTADELIFIFVDGWSNSINVAGAYTLSVEYSP